MTAKEKKYIYDREYSKSRRGLLMNIYWHQVGTSKRRGHDAPSYSSKEFADRFENDTDYIKIHSEWVQLEYDTKYTPSFDRIDANKGYSFNNIAVTTHYKNRRIHYNNVLNGNGVKSLRPVKKIALNGIVIEEYKSIAIACRENNVFASGVSACCRGKARTAGGFRWAYA